MLKVERVGLLANLVDVGRTKVQAQGYSQSGALDWISYHYANALLGQALSLPAIEVLGGHFTCRFDQTCLICITGADADVCINGSLIGVGNLHLILAGERLSINQLNSGLVNYIGLKAKLTLPQFGNSVCAVLREKRGGIYENGASLTKDDCIKGTPVKVALSSLHRTPNDKTVQDIKCKLSNNLKRIFTQFSHFTKVINIGLAYQVDLFTPQQISQFTYNTYTVSNHTDRMGMRLQGLSIDCANKILPSQPVVYGAVQVTGDGLPIIMRNDRQTIGGYPIIGVVDRLSMALLGQSLPGQTITFSITDFEKSRQQSLLLSSELEKLSTIQAQLFKNEE